MDRRSSLKLIGLASVGSLSGCTWTSDDVERARQATHAAKATGSFERQFFTEREFQLASVLSDLTIPADDRSGSASEVGVPEFIDFIVTENAWMETPLRGGLAWLDRHARTRFGSGFIEIADEQRRSILDEIAFPEDAEPDVQHGVAFFNIFRSLIASGFWTTREGIDDLGYLGNTAVASFAGPPQSEMDRLGVTFDDWEVA